MPSKDRKSRHAFTFLWKINNFQYCLERRDEVIKSPNFVVDTMEKTEWRLLICPRCGQDGEKIGYFLQREQFDKGPKAITVDYNLSFLSADGTPYESLEVKRHYFKPGHTDGDRHFVSRDEIFNKEGDTLLADMLTARCQLWWSTKKSENIGHCFARTRIGVEHQSFNWPIRNISSFQPKDKKITSVSFASNKKQLLTFTAFLKGEPPYEESIQIEVSQKNTNRKNLCFCRVSVLNALGKITISTQGEYLFVVRPGEQAWCIPTLISKSKLMEDKHLYLIKDVLYLQCECAISVGVISNEIERTNYEFKQSIFSYSPSVPANLYNVSRSTPDSTSTLKDDLRNMYAIRKFCDVTLHSGNTSFPVHKALLSSRSPVFEAMFESGMTESQSGVVDIPDLDVETVHRMLLYVYTETLNPLDWTSAASLLVAGDKYGILSLKERCSSFLKTTISDVNACEILVLADMHQDDDLKTTVQNFILSSGSKIILSEEWKRFEQNHLRLANETLRLIFLKKLVV